MREIIALSGLGDLEASCLLNLTSSYPNNTESVCEGYELCILGGSENDRGLHRGCGLLPNVYSAVKERAWVQGGRGLQECVSCSATIKFVVR